MRGWGGGDEGGVCAIRYGGRGVECRGKGVEMRGQCWSE